MRTDLTNGALQNRKLAFARQWLDEKNTEREGAERRTDRNIARAANRRATWANIIAALALAVAVVALVRGA